MTLAICTDTGLTDVYVHFKQYGVAVAVAEGTGANVCWYTVLEASLVTAGLPANPSHSGRFLRGNPASPNLTTDPEVGVFSGFNWSGSTEISTEFSLVEIGELITQILEDTDWTLDPAELSGELVGALSAGLEAGSLALTVPQLTALRAFLINTSNKSIDHLVTPKNINIGG